jgi:L-amino acid N-acyltransferase YncA
MAHMPDIIIRTADPDRDAKVLLEIYKPYVEETAITFEYTVPTVEEFKGRIKHTLETHPYLVAEENGKILGYVYASQLGERAAYSWAVETSIYIAKDQRGKGLGRKLYEALEAILKKQNITNANACIGYTKKPDPHLTNGSTSFHEKMGYKQIAYFTACGYKFDTWYDMIWMEKMLGDHPVPAKPFIKFKDLDK